MLTSIGPYRIVEKIGEGGMGEVYRATDTNLKRAVAIKVLPASLAGDAERLARFQREAEVLAALNHPNIAAIYGLERSGAMTALVMELVEGEDLSQRIARGAIPLDEALPIAKQIADALEAAHEQGIIHRDLKPANIKVRADGTVKVLDFGLAKAMDSGAGGAGLAGRAGGENLTQSPTITTPAMTQAGMILGTAAYMSPEQAKGRTVDRRADVWAFGAVLYEMLSGHRAFTGEDISDTLANVLKTEPDWNRLPTDMSPRVRLALHSCLQKDPKRRLGDMQSVRLALEGAFETAAPSTSSSARSSASRGRLVWMVAATAALAAFAMAVPAMRHLREATPDEPGAVRFQIPAPGNTPAEMFKLSPDGRVLAFVAPDGGVNRLWLRSLDSLDARALPGTDAATYPFWSPDSEHLGFFAQGKLKKIATAGGPPLTLCDAANGRGGTWNRDGEILFSPTPVGPLYRVPAAGGVTVPATKVAVAGANEGHSLPEFLPDGRHFFYLIKSPTPEAGGIYVGALDGAMPVRILPDESNAAYAPPAMPGDSGLVLFRREDTLMAQPFDPVRVQTTGEMAAIAEHVAVTGNIGSGAFSVAATGALVFRGASGANREMVWIDRSGRRSAAVGKPFADDGKGTGFAATLSPDEKRVAFAVLDRNQTDIWLLNLAQGGMSRFTFGQGAAASTNLQGTLRIHPIWSPDGSRLVFGTRTGGVLELHEKALAGGDEQLLLRLAGVTNVLTWDWSPDGKLIVYSATSEKTANDLYLLPMNGDHTPAPYLQTPASEVDGHFSPDGRWMAYVSDETGQKQVFVQPFPSSGAKWQVSTSGGAAPQWRHDGAELFYVAPGQHLMAVSVKATGNFEAGSPEPLPVIVPVTGAFANNEKGYAATRDGQRFLVNVPAGGEGAAAPPITVVLNWQAGLPKR